MDRRIAAIASISISLFAGTTTAIAQSLVVGPNVNISKSAGYQGETAIAINPTNPLSMFTWSNNITGPAVNFAAFTTNGGNTWTGRTTGSDGFPALGGDPSCTYDSFGNLYATSFNSAFTQIVIGRSVDGGQTFTTLTGFAIVDQPTVKAGPGSNGAPQSVWITYVSSTGLAARGAASNGVANTGAFGALQLIPGGGSGNFGDVAIGPGGRVAVGYQTPSGGVGPSNIQVAVDADGLGAGAFGAAGAAVTTQVGGFRPIPAQPNRTVDAEMGLAYDNTGGPRNGRLYMVYTDAPNTTSNDLNIFVRSSTNDGLTWSAAVKVNDDVGATSQFFSKIAIDPITGNIAVVWLDARNDPTNNRLVELWGTVSLDGGLTFLPNVKIAAGQTNGTQGVIGNANEMGDYIGVDFYNNVFYPVWADNSNSTNDNPNGALSSLDIYGARVTLVSIPEPVTLLLLGSVAGGYLLRRRVFPRMPRRTISYLRGR